MVLPSLSKGLTFLAAALVPVPALRAFAFQASILTVFTLGATLLIFPAILSLDLKRRRANRPDLLCCCLPAPTTMTKERSTPRHKLQAVTRALPPDRKQTVTSVLAPSATDKVRQHSSSSSFWQLSSFHSTLILKKMHLITNEQLHSYETRYDRKYHVTKCSLILVNTLP